jgi:hypothetical protein
MRPPVWRTPGIYLVGELVEKRLLEEQGRWRPIRASTCSGIYSSSGQNNADRTPAVDETRDQNDDVLLDP